MCLISQFHQHGVQGRVHSALPLNARLTQRRSANDGHAVWVAGWALHSTFHVDPRLYFANFGKLSAKRSLRLRAQKMSPTNAQKPISIKEKMKVS